MRAARPSSSLAIPLLALIFGACQCEMEPMPWPDRVETFAVEILEINPVNPPSQTGDSPEQALPIPEVPIRMKVKVTALDEDGQVFDSLDRWVSFRITPGKVLDVMTAEGATTGNRMLHLTGGVGEGWVVVEKVFSDVYLWAQDSPPPPVFALPSEEGADDSADAGPADVAPPVDLEQWEPDGGRTHAAGVSRAIWFAPPSIPDVQRVPTTVEFGKEVKSNKYSAFQGNFLTVEGRQPESDMIVTAITAEGFYVTDMLAPRLEYSKGTLGNFGSIFVYNYSYPDGLLVGDRVTSLTGTVQEFSGHTQLVFPSWVRLEGEPRPQDLPEPTLFDFSNPNPEEPSSGFKLCGVYTKYSPKVPSMDTLCAYSNKNLDVESMEASLVRVVNAKPTTVFADCDHNGNANVPPFSWWGMGAEGGWHCFDSGDDTADCECNKACITSQGEYEGKVCAELNTYKTFGQWILVLEDKWKTRINVSTRDALPDLDPRKFGDEAHAGCTVDVTGILRQVQAARPRWMIIARDQADVCCRAPQGKTCPDGIPECPKGEQ